VTSTSCAILNDPTAIYLSDQLRAHYWGFSGCIRSYSLLEAITAPAVPASEYLSNFSTRLYITPDISCIQHIQDSVRYTTAAGLVSIPIQCSIASPFQAAVALIKNISGQAILNVARLLRFSSLLLYHNETLPPLKNFKLTGNGSKLHMYTLVNPLTPAL